MRNTQKADFEYIVKENTITKQLTRKCAPKNLEKRMLSDGNYEKLQSFENNEYENHYEPNAAQVPKDKAMLLDVADGKVMDIMKKCISQAAKIGIETIVTHPSFEPNDAESRRDKMDCSIENMSILSKFCKNLGAVLTVEDLPRTCLGNCSEEIIEFLNSVDDLMFCFDTNHVTAQKNEDFLDELIKHHFQGRVRTIHVSDYDGIDERHRLPFDGTNNWEEIVSKLKSLNITECLCMR